MKRKLKELAQFEWDLFKALGSADLAAEIEDGETLAPRAYELAALRLWFTRVEEPTLTVSEKEKVLAKVIEHLKRGGYRDDDEFAGLFVGE